MASVRSSCPSCGGAVRPRDRFCPSCGAALAAGVTETAVIPPPPDETGRVPVRVERVAPTLYGVTPATVLLVLGLASLLVGILLAVLGQLAVGVGLALLGLFLLALFLESARRRPEGRVARRTARALEELRRRTGLAATTLAAQSSVRRELARAREELVFYAEERERLLRELGEAVYGGDEARRERTVAALRTVDEQTAAKEAEVRQAIAQAEERVQRARLEVQPTEMVEIPGEPGTQPGIAEPGPDPRPPEPPRLPETEPPPDLEPPRIPEPYPPPSEAERL